MKRNEFIDNFNLATIPMMALMRLAPPDKIGWKPTEKSWTLGQLLHHCSGTPNIFNRIIDNSWPSLEELRKSMAASLTVSLLKSSPLQSTNSFASFPNMAS